MPDNEEFNNLEEKNTNDFALVFGVFVVTIVLGLFAAMAIISVKDKVGYYWEVDQKSRKKVETQITKSKKSTKITGSIRSKNESSETLMDKTFSDYMPNMQKKIKDNWNPPKRNSQLKTILSYQIGKSGELLEYKIILSSGDDEFDNIAVDALKKSTPFEPLPKSFDGDNVKVQFTFDYKAYMK